MTPHFESAELNVVFKTFTRPIVNATIIAGERLVPITSHSWRFIAVNRTSLTQKTINEKHETSESDEKNLKIVSPYRSVIE